MSLEELRAKLACGCQRHYGGREPCKELKALLLSLRHSTAGEANLAAMEAIYQHVGRA